jgi:transposase
LLLGIDWSTAQVTMQRAVTRVLERRSVDEVTRVGIDQKSFGKRQDYVTVMTDIDESRVPEVTPDRTPESADIRWKTLSPKQRSQVRAVCMGMLQAYETSTETPAPKALIVHDSCHISKYLNEAVDKVRQAEHRELQQTGDDRLKGMRQTLLVAPENLSDEKNDELAALRQSTLATGRAWSIDRRFPQSPIGRATRMLKHRPYQMLKWCSSAITHIASEGSYNRIRASSPAATGLQLFDRCRIKRLF